MDDDFLPQSIYLSEHIDSYIIDDSVSNERGLQLSDKEQLSFYSDITSYKKDARKREQTIAKVCLNDLIPNLNSLIQYIF